MTSESCISCYKNVISSILAVCIILFVGARLASNFSYNLLIQNKEKKWMVFVQHPIKYIINKGELER